MEWPSTLGSGLRVSRLIPMTDWMVLMAATPSLPVSSAALAGRVMSVMLGVILAQTGMVAFLLIQPDTSCVEGAVSVGFSPRSIRFGNDEQLRFVTLPLEQFR